MKPRRSRLRRLLKWTGTVACGLILVAAALSFYWTHVILYRGSSWYLWIYNGAVSIKGPSDIASISSWETIPTVGRTYHSLEEAFNNWYLFGRWVEFENAPSMPWELSIPLWLPFLPISVPTAWLWWRDRRRTGPGCCPACGYNLTGNVTGRCPECGAAATAGSPAGPSE